MSTALVNPPSVKLAPGGIADTGQLWQQTERDRERQYDTRQLGSPSNAGKRQERDDPRNTSQSQEKADQGSQ